MKVAFIGEGDCVLGFSGLGATVVSVSDEAGALKALEELKEKDCSVVFITETYARNLLERIDEISSGGRMNISIIPGSGKKEGLAGQRMKKIAIRATGMDPEKQPSD